MATLYKALKGWKSLSLKSSSCHKINILLKSKINILNFFRFVDHLPYDFVPHIVYKFKRGRCNTSYGGKTDKH